MGSCIVGVGLGVSQCWPQGIPQKASLSAMWEGSHLPSAFLGLASNIPEVSSGPLAKSGPGFIRLSLGAADDISIGPWPHTRQANAGLLICSLGPARN